jgi:hypothetical protein
MEGSDQSPTNKSVLKDTNVHPLISDVFNNIFNMTQRNKEWEEIKKSLNLTEDEKGNI